MQFDELTYNVIGCAMKVYNVLGNGFQEVIYQRCLAIELHKAKIAFRREVEQTIYYEGMDVGRRRADFIVEDKIIVELKASINLEDVHLAQAKNYLIAYDFPVDNSGRRRSRRHRTTALLTLHNNKFFNFSRK